MRGADYVIKRGFFALVTIYVAITINFFLFRVLPGNAVTDLSRVPHASPALRHALLTEFGLDKPKWEQYLIYLKNLAHGNMGISFANQQPVSHLLLADLKNTIPMVTWAPWSRSSSASSPACCPRGGAARHPITSAPTRPSSSTPSRPSGSG